MWNSFDEVSPNSNIVLATKLLAAALSNTQRDSNEVLDVNAAMRDNRRPGSSSLLDLPPGAASRQSNLSSFSMKNRLSWSSNRDYDEQRGPFVNFNTSNVPMASALHNSNSFSKKRGGDAGDFKRFSSGSDLRNNFRSSETASRRSNEKPLSKYVSGKNENQGKKYFNSVEQESEAYSGLPKEVFKCYICAKSMWDSPSFVRHTRGRNHIQMMDAYMTEHEKKIQLMRSHIRFIEERRNVRSEKNREKGNTKLKRGHCSMCDVDCYSSMLDHRKSEYHQNLRRYLHPTCTYCNMEFTTRVMWEEHILSGAHLQVIWKYSQDNGIEVSNLLEVLDDQFIKFFQSNLSIGSTSGREVPTDDVDKDDIKEEEVKYVEAPEDDDGLISYEIPPYDADMPIGGSYVKKIVGFFCRGCKKFFAGDMVTHCKEEAHYEKFVAATNVRKEKAIQKLASISKDSDTTIKRLQKGDNDDEGTNWKRRRTGITGPSNPN